jgi:predicted acyltransferase
MATAPSPSKRILGLDVFRGMTIAFMIIVNTPGNGSLSWGPLQHARWHGFTPTDLVFPSFLFAIGVSAWFSLKKFEHQPSRDALLKIWRRTAILYLIGLLMWHVPNFLIALFTLKLGHFFSDLFTNIRILGVLQRLALCYGIGSTLALVLSRRALIGVGGVLLLGYWAIMRAFGEGADPYALQTNAALRLDLWLMGPNHLYHGENVGGQPYAFDPEGALSTIPAIVTFIIGYLTGQFLDRTPDRRHALSELFPTAFLLIAGGFLWSYWLGFPINKKLWTSSYALYVGGLSLLILSLVFWAVDVKGRTRLFSFFNIFGRSPLLAYITSEMLVVVFFTVKLPGPDGQGQDGYSWLYNHTGALIAGDNAIGSFLFAVGFMLANWVIAWAFYKRGVVIKI